MKYLFFFGVFLFIGSIVWMGIIHFFVYFDSLLTPKEKLSIYWVQGVVCIIGCIIIMITEKKV